jgi:hypothetical protein
MVRLHSTDAGSCFPAVFVDQQSSICPKLVLQKSMVFGKELTAAAQKMSRSGRGVGHLHLEQP